MVTPEFIYKKWCEICEREGRNVDPKWFTPEGKRAFVKSPAVIELSKFAYRIVTPALSHNFKISDALRQARRRVDDERKLYEAQKASKKSKSRVRKRQSPRPATRQSSKSTSRKSSSGPILNNSPTYYSASQGHQPHSRVTPTSTRALCPACGQIEDGCPCSR